MERNTSYDPTNVIKWNSHQNAVVRKLQLFYGSNEFTDCILIAGDLEIHAHKVVLSSCSPYLKMLLEKCTDKEPMIIFRDCTAEDIRAIVDFMYFGEMTIPSDHIERMLKIGTDLQIDGLLYYPDVEDGPPNSMQNQGNDAQNINGTGYSVQSYPHCSQYNPTDFPYGYGNIDQSQNYSYGIHNRSDGQIGNSLPSEAIPGLDIYSDQSQVDASNADPEPTGMNFLDSKDGKLIAPSMQTPELVASSLFPENTQLAAPFSMNPQLVDSSFSVPPPPATDDISKLRPKQQKKKGTVKKKSKKKSEKGNTSERKNQPEYDHEILGNDPQNDPNCPPYKSSDFAYDYDLYQSQNYDGSHGNASTSQEIPGTNIFSDQSQINGSNVVHKRKSPRILRRKSGKVFADLSQSTRMNSQNSKDEPMIAPSTQSAEPFDSELGASFALNPPVDPSHLPQISSVDISKPKSPKKRTAEKKKPKKHSEKKNVKKTPLKEKRDVNSVEGDVKFIFLK